MSFDIVIGTAPCSWGVWWADGTPSHTPYSVFLDQAAEAGYQALELGPVGYLPTDVDQLREELSRRKLRICGGTACYDFLHAASFADVRADVDDLCRRLRAFGVPYMMTMDGASFSPAQKRALADEQRRVYGIFAEMGRYCRGEYGIETLVHPERNSLIETGAELERLIELGLSVCFDNGHFTAANGGWQRGDRAAMDFVRDHIGAIPYLHFKNVSIEMRRMQLEEHLDPTDPRCQDIMCDLEDGIIDYEAYRDLLDALNFRGVGIIEQDCPNSTTAQAFASAKKNLAYLQRIGLVKESRRSPTFN
jgi:inosose dehydratase